jgi:bifunctional N-acetylglucosamine-1-phosphate-uridyltransferase/glucosamine-1-phosphate-acetyltransferase GlmU-like protein
MLLLRASSKRHLYDVITLGKSDLISTQHELTKEEREGMNNRTKLLEMEWTVKENIMRRSTSMTS